MYYKRDSLKIFAANEFISQILEDKNNGDVDFIQLLREYFQPTR